MILIKEVGFDEEGIEQFLLFLKEEAVTPEKQKNYLVYKDFLQECLILDKDLQKDVTEKIGEDFISYIKVPSEETDDFSNLEFGIANKNNGEVGKRENLLYYQLCKNHFQFFVGLQDRL